MDPYNDGSPTTLRCPISEPGVSTRPQGYASPQPIRSAFMVEGMAVWAVDEEDARRIFNDPG